MLKRLALLAVVSLVFVIHNPAAQASTPLTVSPASITVRAGDSINKTKTVTVELGPHPGEIDLFCVANGVAQKLTSIPAGAAAGGYRGNVALTPPPAEAKIPNVEIQAWENGELVAAATLDVVYAAGYAGVTYPGGISPNDFRGDPAGDADVVGLANAQAVYVDHAAQIQTGNIHSRLARRRGFTEAQKAANDFTLNVGLPQGSETKRVPLMRDQNPAASAPTTINVGEILKSAPAKTGAGEDPALQAASAWSFWSDGFVNFGSLSQDGGLDNRTSGVTLGVDREFFDGMVAGAAVGHTRDRTDVGALGSRSTGEANSASLYGSYSLSPAFYFQGVLGYSSLDVETKRNTASGFALGDRNGGQYFGSLSSGYEFRRKKLLISPFARLDGSTARFDDFTERGAGVFALRHNGPDVDTVALTPGIRGEYAINRKWGQLTPGLGFEFAHNFRDTISESVGYLDQNGLPYTLSSEAIASNTARISASLGANIGKDLQVGAAYQCSVAKEQRDHILNFNAAWSF